MHANEIYGERETGCFVRLVEYLGGYGGNGLPGSGSWSCDYYNGPYGSWQQILAGGSINLIKRIMLSENELFYYYERLGYMGYPNALNPQRYRYPRPNG
jgi:hypothetical protein